ncbi:solute:sodium symporter family transporter [Butyricicoccus faecihominis]|uniref:solute:sodium symporter family transporter n=1 Tax=Butyricicoccaceae TaxID=3085642 RepID=UPI0024795764|nr:MULTISPECIES: solute:sodium symporter family transporter [Butyricicoccaceae]MCQ5129207.1 solute:sodium symporter family transporter [Butyricicoccus faecihominis]WNX86286.1 solute:sodium symporter family transporter [Agathobaculum sp. NTUH-O15-33]
MSFLNSMAFTAITFLAFTALVALISWWKTRGDNLDTQDGYYLAGRGLTGPIIAGSLLMTNLSAEQLVGTNGQAVRVGMGPIAWEVTAAMALIVMAFFLMPKYLKTGLTTVPEFFEQRYDAGTRRLVSLIVLLSYIVIMLPNILYAGAQVFSNIFDLPGLTGWSEFACIAVVCVATAFVGSIYAIFGGLKAIALSDSINGLGLIVGGLLVPIFGLIALGQMHGGNFMQGVDVFLHSEPEMMNAINPANAPEPYMPWPLLLTGMFINNMYFWGTNQSIIQRTFGAKNLKEAQKGAVLAGFLKILTPLIVVIPGIIAFMLYGSAAQANSGDAGYPMLVANVMPKPILGFFAAVMFGAILSSFNSVLNSASTIYALDIHRPSFNPTASDAYMVKVGQRFGTVVAIVSTIMAPFMLYMGGITTFVNSMFAAFNTPILVCLVCGFFWKKVPTIAPKIIIPVHVVLYFTLQFGLRNVIPFLKDIHYLYFTAVLFVVDMFIMWVIVKKRPRETDFVLNDVKAVELTPWKHGKLFATITLAVMVLAYILFSPLVFAK